MRLMVRDGNDLIDSKEFHARKISIGSDPACEVRLSDRRVMPTHATLVQHEDGTWLIESAGGDNSVLLNGRPVLRSTPIQPSDEIDILNYTIAVYRSSGESFAPAEQPKTMVSENASKLRDNPLPAGAIIKRSGDDLKLSGHRTRELAEAALRLPDCAEIPDLIDLVLDDLLDRFAGRMAYVGVRRKNYGRHEFVQGRNVGGKNVDPPPDFDNLVFRCHEQQQFICMPQTPHPEIGSALAVPLGCDRGELGILYVDRKKNATPFQEEDLDRLTAHAALHAAKLKRIILAQTDARQAVQNGQLAFLREIQTRMDPSMVPQWPGIQLAVYCKPGTQRGGDIYDVMRIPNGLASIMVANVAGEATRTALAMAEIRSAFRIAGLHADAPHVFLRSVNWMLCEDRAPSRMTAVALVMNPRTGTFDCSTAGAIGALIVDARGDTRDLADHEIQPAGAVPGFAYVSKTDRLQQGESLALFTAGCHTICDAAGRPLGEARFIESVRDGFGQSAATALDELIQDQAGFFKNGRLPDDITILLFHRVAVPA